MRTLGFLLTAALTAGVSFAADTPRPSRAGQTAPASIWAWDRNERQISGEVIGYNVRHWIQIQDRQGKDHSINLERFQAKNLPPELKVGDTVNVVLAPAQNGLSVRIDRAPESQVAGNEGRGKARR